jgi:hypothetical protein
MKQLLFLFLSILNLNIALGQKVVNTDPYVNMDFRKALYVEFDNPIHISTGKYKSLNVSVNNGTIRKTGVPGKFIVRPNRCAPIIVTLSSPGYRKEFAFECAILRDPEVQLVGDRYEHNVPSIRRSEGIYAKHTPYDLDIVYKILSFELKVWDSSGKRTHKNIGAAWDSTARLMIKTVAKGGELTIDNIILVGPDGRKRYGERFWARIWE